MRDQTKTRLILIEGISGSGKSTLAQFLTQTLTDNDRSCRWYYEEEKNHPLYVFHDRISLQQTVEDLSSGRYHKVINTVLEKWKALVQHLESSETTLILDGCLFGYLTWSLFPLDIPATEIQHYLSQVEQIIRPIQPCLIYLYQQDLAHALEKICTRRGEETRSWLMAQSTESAYGKRRDLQGFAGMVTYWQDFRTLIESTLSHFTLSHLNLENSGEDWRTYEHTVLDFLGLPIKEEISALSPSHLARFVGMYHSERESCLISLEQGQLIIDGLPLTWQKTRLLPLTHTVFAVESLPFQIRFKEDTRGTITTMQATGPELLDGTLDHLFTRKQ